MQTADFQQILSGHYHILDVRHEYEYRQAAVDGALWLPLAQLQSSIADLIPDKSVPVLVYCAAGVRAQMACHIMCSMGYQQVFNIGGVQQAAIQTQRGLIAGGSSRSICPT